MLKEIFEVFFGRSWAGFFKSVGKIRDPDSNESLKPGDYDAKKFLPKMNELVASWSLS